MIVTYPEHPIRNVADLIKTAKARSEPLLGGVPGAGTPQHLLIEYFSRLAGIKIQVVPFRGGNQALTELLGKRIDFLIDPPIALHRPDQVRRAASDRRHRRLALPAAAECRHHRRSRLPGLFRDVLDGRGRPGQAAGQHAARLNKELNELVAEPAVIERIRALGSEPKSGPPENFTSGSQQTSPAGTR